MLLWMMDAVERDAQLLLESMKGIGKNDTALLGILCSRTPSELQLISQTYFKTYHKSLESQIEGDTSGDYRKVSD
jgi:annexin A7/11